jgi:hypothetical protein
MYVVRWLMSHPIVAIWALTIIALLMSMSGGEKHKASIASENIDEIKNKKEEALNTKLEVAPVLTQEQANIVVRSPQVVAGSSVSPQKQSHDVETEKGDTATEPEQEKLSIEGLEDKSIDDLLLMARESYWNNGLDEAAAIYQQLIQREPNIISHKGELGNVYWKQGFPEKSANLYAEIAAPMIKNGHAERVSNMVGFIGLFHPDKATEIKKQLQGLKAQN